MKDKIKIIHLLTSNCHVFTCQVLMTRFQSSTSTHRVGQCFPSPRGWIGCAPLIGDCQVIIQKASPWVTCLENTNCSLHVKKPLLQISKKEQALCRFYSRLNFSSLSNSQNFSGGSQKLFHWLSHLPFLYYFCINCRY